MVQRRISQRLLRTCSGGGRSVFAPAGMLASSAPALGGFTWRSVDVFFGVLMSSGAMRDFGCCATIVLRDGDGLQVVWGPHTQRGCAQRPDVIEVHSLWNRANGDLIGEPVRFDLLRVSQSEDAVAPNNISRPEVASRSDLDMRPESVHHGKDGLLFWYAVPSEQIIVSRAKSRFQAVLWLLTAVLGAWGHQQFSGTGVVHRAHPLAEKWPLATGFRAGHASIVGDAL